MNNCDICGGSRIVRFPVREKLNTYPEDYSTIKPLSVREYPCPECSEKIPLEKIEIVQVEEYIPLEYKVDFDLLEHIKQGMAAQIGDFLYKEGMITYKTGKEDLYTRSKPIRAKLGVLSPRQVKTFEERVNDRQLDVASSLVNEAVSQIRNWGSLFDSEYISKTVAIQFLYNILNKAKK
jgi:hypothetical protein